MRLFSFFRRKSPSPVSPSSTPRTKPRGKIAAPALVGSLRSEPKEIVDLAERMEDDYQVQLARRVLAANIQSVQVSITASGADSQDPRVAALAERLQRLWDCSLPNMLPAIAYGRVAFEKIFVYDPAHNLVVVKSLDALPYRESELILGADGAYQGIDLAIGNSKVRIPADKSWWLALDATVMEPHGKSQYLGAPADTFRRREKTRKRFDTLMNRLSVRGLIAYHPLDEEDERGNRYDPGEVLAGQLDALVSGGHLLLPNTRHPLIDDYAYKVQETTEVLRTAPLLAAIADEDAEQLRAFGIPEKTVTEGDSVGSHAMVKQQTLVLYAVVDGLLAQFANSFQKYVIDKSVELNFDPNDRPRITIHFPRLAERPDSILAQVVTSLLGSPHLNPLVESGAIDVQQLLESAGIPLTGDVQQQLTKFLAQQKGSSKPARSGQQIPGGEAALDQGFEEKHPRHKDGEFAPKGTVEERADAGSSDATDPSKRIDTKLYGRLAQIREAKLDSFRQVVTQATEALTSRPNLPVEERAAIVQDLLEKADEAKEMGESDWAALLEQTAGEHIKAHSRAVVESSIPARDHETNSEQGHVTTNFQNIPADRVEGLVKDKLAQEYKGYVYIADIAPGNQISVMVLEPIREHINPTEVGEVGGRLYQEEPKYKTTGYRVVKHFVAPDHDPGALGRFQSQESAKLNINAAINEKQAGADQNFAGTVTFLCHLAPFGAALDAATEGDGVEAAISLAGDAAFFFTGPLGKAAFAGRHAKAFFLAGAALEGGIAAARGTQGVFALRQGDNLAAAGYFGEATLRLLGMSKEAVQALKKAPKGANYDPGLVPGPNPNGLRRRVVDSPTAGEGGVYLKPHNGKTKIGSTDDFQGRYGPNAPDGIEVEIPQTRTGPPAGTDDSAYPWSGRYQRRFDEEYVDRTIPREARYRAPRAVPPVSQENWDKFRHIFGYGDVPSDFGN